MRFHMVRPNEILRDYIKYYCFMESDSGEPDVVERVIPTENVQLMFHYGRPFAVHGPDKEVSLQPRALVSGLTDSFSDVSTDGATGVVFVAFESAGACRFLGIPLSEIENRSLDMTDLFGNEIRLIEERMFLARTTAERTAILERYLMGRFSDIPAYDGLLVREGIRLVKQCGGRITVRGLADRLYTTEKSLERKFSRYVGKAPKQYMQLIRFQGIMVDMYRGGPTNLTDLAQKYGYYDQPHFIRDFKCYTGYTPGDFLSKYPTCEAEEASRS